MPSAVRLREDYSAEELRGLARRSKNVNQSRRLLSLAAVLSGMDRGGVIRIPNEGINGLQVWKVETTLRRPGSRTCRSRRQPGR
jgi:hypothetical protein